VSASFFGGRVRLKACYSVRGFKCAAHERLAGNKTICGFGSMGSYRFFERCDQRALGREPDWEEYLKVIERSKREGLADTLSLSTPMCSCVVTKTISDSQYRYSLLRQCQMPLRRRLIMPWPRLVSLKACRGSPRQRTSGMSRAPISAEPLHWWSNITRLALVICHILPAASGAVFQA
jgi:hypothetical protein